MVGGEGLGDDDTTPEKRSILHYLGPPGTYSHQVALELLPDVHQKASGQVVLQPCETITTTFQEAMKMTRETGAASWSLLPYENNSNGPVVDSYDVLFAIDAASPMHTSIVGEYYLPVNHSLMCTKQVYKSLTEEDGKLDLKKLDVVSSHSQALGQCSTFLQNRLRAGVELIATTSTGEAARLLRDHQDQSPLKLHACISSKVCAREDVYNLVILQEAIQNSDNNTTRFLLLETHKGERTSSNSTRRRAGYHRAMVRIDTLAASPCLTRFIGAIARRGDSEFNCHIRSIERRAKKDAVDLIDATDMPSEGRWPFVYMIEVEGRVAISFNGQDDTRSSDRKENKRAKKEFDKSETLWTTFVEHLKIAMEEADEAGSTVTCLGIW